MNNHVIFISDLHLDASQKTITALLYQFLNEEAQQADTLYILGDLFEVWCGDDDDTPYFQAIKQALKTYVDSGKRCYIMPGNRDFLLGKQFMQETGAEFLPDPSIVEINGQKILLTHGDTLCTDDIRHQIYRRIIQHRIMKMISRIVPLSTRKKIAQQLRQQSQQYFLKNQGKLRDVVADAVTNTFEKFDVDVIIHGHTHVQGIHHYGNKCRYVLGSWHKQGHAWSLSDRFEEIRISLRSHSEQKA